MLYAMRDNGLTPCGVVEAAGILWGVLRKIAEQEGIEGHMVEHYQAGFNAGRTIADQVDDA